MIVTIFTGEDAYMAATAFVAANRSRVLIPLKELMVDLAITVGAGSTGELAKELLDATGYLPAHCLITQCHKSHAVIYDAPDIHTIRALKSSFSTSINGIPPAASFDTQVTRCYPRTVNQIQAYLMRIAQYYTIDHHEAVAKCAVSHIGGTTPLFNLITDMVLVKDERDRLKQETATLKSVIATLKAKQPQVNPELEELIREVWPRQQEVKNLMQDVMAKTATLSTLLRQLEDN